MQHVGSTGGVSPARNMWSGLFGFGGGGGGWGGVGSVSSWLRLAYIVYVLHWSTRFLVGSLGHDSFAGRPACLGLQDMTGSTLEVCLCLSLVLLLRLVGLRCPSPNEHLKVFFYDRPLSFGRSHRRLYPCLRSDYLFCSGGCIVKLSFSVTV